MQWVTLGKQSMHGHRSKWSVHYVALTVLTLRKGSCWPYRFVKMRSSSLSPPKCVRSGGASGCSGAGVALNARAKLYGQRRNSQALHWLLPHDTKTCRDVTTAGHSRSNEPYSC